MPPVGNLRCLSSLIFHMKISNEACFWLHSVSICIRCIRLLSVFENGYLYYLTPSCKYGSKTDALKHTQWLLLLLSRFSRVQLCASPETAAHQAPPSLGFSRQEHWSGLPFPSPMHESEKWSRSVMSDCSRPHGLQPNRLPCPWDFPGKSSGVGCHCPLGLPNHH